MINEPNTRPRLKMQEDDYAESKSEFVSRDDEIEEKKQQKLKEFERSLNARFVFQSDLMKFKSFQDEMLFVKLELEDRSFRK